MAQVEGSGTADAGLKSNLVCSTSAKLPGPVKLSELKVSPCRCDQDEIVSVCAQRLRGT
jgi:hypothetical protein